MTLIAAQIQQLQQHIRSAALQYQRNPEHITLLAVSKGQPAEKIRAAYAAGLHCFGENYLQEALLKIAALANEQIEWHFIGHIQRNKTRKIAEHFSWVQSIDDSLIASRLNEQRPEHLPPLNICIEVNISGEAAKSGIPPEKVPALIQHCLSLNRLNVRGIMAIPAPAESFEEQRRCFHSLNILWQQLRTSYPMLDTLSMGMTDDFEAAIAEGSTMLRIGRSIFGLRGGSNIL